MKSATHDPVGAKMVVGWREWGQLPDLGIPAIRIKVDTGARTSALHAFNTETFTCRHKEYVRFDIHPVQRNNVISTHCVAALVDERMVTSSNGHRESRLTIRTPVRVGKQQWEIDVTLTNRDIMSYRMLLGREAMGTLIVDPGRSFCLGRMSRKELMRLYQKETA